MASGVAFRDEADLEKLVVRTHPQRQTRAWLYAGAGLAAAAAIALVVTSPQLFNRNQITDLHELVDAVGGNRRTEARLTGGFQWGAVPPIRRGDSNALPVASEAVATKLTQMPDGGRAETVALKGVAALILGDSANAVTQLESAVARESGRARFWSDLAAAYLEAARTGGRSRGVDDALSAANRALQIDPALPEALFNRAFGDRLNPLYHLGAITFFLFWVVGVTCLLYTSDAADERSSVDLGGRRIIKKNTKVTVTREGVER